MRRVLPLLPALSLGRRELIQWIGAVAAARSLPACSSATSPAATPPPAPPFLTTAQQNALAAIADYILPPDKDPGGSALGVVSYVEQTLTALDGPAPMIFAGGPYSGRQPYGAPDGTPSKNFPPDSFTTFLPLDRYRQAAWELRLFGSSGVPGGGLNDAVIGKTVGWRDQVTQALDAAIAATSGPLDTKTSAAEVEHAFGSIDLAGKTLLTELVIEGCFSSPEYGGNASLGGFAICNFAGDSQPLGYSLFDETTSSYKERPDAPVSSPNPGTDPDPMDAATLTLISTLVAFAGGKEYF